MAVTTAGSAVGLHLPEADVSEKVLPPPVDFARSDTRTQARLATLDPNDEAAKEWLAAVRRYLPPGDIDPIATLRAIHRVYKEWGFRFGLLSRSPDGEDDRVVANVQPPGRFLRSRAGRCIDNSLLTAATLRALGVPFVLISTVEHVVAAAIVESKRARRAGDLIVEVQLNKDRSARRKTVFLAPLDLNPVGLRGADFDEAARHGRQFLRAEAHSYSQVLVGKDGEILKGRCRIINFGSRPTAALGVWAPTAAPLRPARLKNKSAVPQF